jgi:hypothetical protein
MTPSPLARPRPGRCSGVPRDTASQVRQGPDRIGLNGPGRRQQVRRVRILVDGTLGQSVRLEQERVGFAAIEGALAGLQPARLYRCR